MHIRDLAGKTVCVLGYGKEGKAAVDALEQFAPGCEITIADKNTAIERDQNPKHWWQLGEGFLENLSKFDVIIKSPGVPPSKELAAVADKITSGTALFLDSIPEKTIVIGVTGTKGKSTTTSLIAAILKAAGKDVQMVGNIGEPAIGHLSQIKENTIVVQEMSSYQLQDLQKSPHIAVITSLYPEHLDYHGSLEAYKEAKKHIVRFQKKDDWVFFSPGAKDIAMEGKGQKLEIPRAFFPKAITSMRLLGDHNKGNAALAWKVTEHLGVPEGIAFPVIKEFQGLPHRLQSLGIHHGLEWVDDAISTTPESAVEALNALGDRVKTILLGGQDRGVDFAPLIKRLSHSSVENILLFPGSGERLAGELDEANVQIAKFPVTSMEEAVKLAILHTPANGIVLLSPASPSYGMYKNFEEKGDIFAACIKS